MSKPEDYREKIEDLAKGMAESADSDIVQKLKDASLAVLNETGGGMPEVVLFCGLMLGSILSQKPNLNGPAMADVVKVVAVRTRANLLAKATGENDDAR